MILDFPLKEHMGLLLTEYWDILFTDELQVSKKIHPMFYSSFFYGTVLLAKDDTNKR